MGGVVLCCIGIALIVIAGLRAQSAYTGSFDEGVFWNTFKSIERGGQAYSDVYMSQPPGFLLAIYPLYVVMGSTLEAARLAVFAYSLIGLLAICWLGWELRSVTSALLGIAVLYSLSSYVSEITTLRADSLPIVFSTSALASVFRFRNTGKRRWLLITGVLAGFALSIKADFSVIPVVILVLLLGCFNADLRSRNSDFHGWHVTAQIVTVGAAASCLLGAVSAPFGADDVWHDVVGLRLSVAAQGATRSFVDVLDDEPGLLALFRVAVVLATAGVVFVRTARLPLVVLVVWTATTTVMLSLYRPLADHHMVLLSVPLAFLASYAAISLALIRLPSKCVTMAVVACLAASIAHRGVAGLSVVQGATNHKQDQGIALIRGSTAESDYVICDDGLVLASSDRPTPPELVDISLARVRSGALTSSTLEEAMSTYRPKLIVAWADRLIRIPDFTSTMARHGYRAIRLDGTDVSHLAYFRG